MKKQYLPLALALALFQGVSAQSRFDASSQIYADHYLDFVREPGAELVEIPGLPFTINPASRSEITADVMLILNEGTTAEDIESFGLTVKGIIG
ncbi:MAG: hypothetical protein K2L80_01800, partial [Muribaculaceae bacterium]|nr:hypothetical protein [Muribaculaceae bacterium]